MILENCPRCDCTTLQYQEILGYWECLDCGHTWGFDEDDPDYDESVSCPDCWGTGLIYAYVNDSQPSKCTTCKGTGYM
jgi:DnaJ-class molecular chaperone